MSCYLCYCFSNYISFKEVFDKYPKSDKNKNLSIGRKSNGLTVPHLTALGCELFSDEGYN